MGGRRSVPLLIGVITALALPTTQRPAEAVAGYVYAHAGGVATGISATSVGQDVTAVMTYGSNLYITDRIHAVVRSVNLSTGYETWVAGYGSYGYSGDGGQATSAGLDFDSIRSPNSIAGTAVDSSGNLYIADPGTNRVRKVNTSGVISTVAGTSTAGFSGDGGAATSATLNHPAGVAVDTSGNLYIADTVNQRIRKVNTSGTISTIAGTGTAGFSGDGGAATSANLNYPQSLVASGSDVYVADTFNHRVRKINGSGTISTYAGTGSAGYNGDNQAATSAQLNYPFSVSIGSGGYMLIADYGNHRIRNVSSGGTITTVAGTGTGGFSGDGGAATSAKLQNPLGVIAADTNTFYVADHGNRRARKVASGTITTVAGNGTVGPTGDGGTATSAELNGAFGVATDSSGNTYVSDEGNNVIRKISSSGTITTVAGNGTPGFSGDGGPATSAQLDSPYGVAVDADGNLYISDTNNQRIRKVFASNGYIYTIAGTGTSGFSGDGGNATSANINGPVGIFAVSTTLVYFADSSNHRIRSITQSGSSYTINTVAGSGSSTHGGDGGAATSAGINTPTDVAVQASTGDFVIAEQKGHYVRKVMASTGVISSIAGKGAPPSPPPCFDSRLDNYSHPALGDGGPATSAQLNCPTGVAIDSSGNVYIADFEIDSVRKVFASNGYIYTVVGVATFGWSGDGGDAATARAYGPTSLRLDANGDLIFADHGNNRTRRLDN